MSFIDGGYNYFITSDTALLKTCSLTSFSGAVIPAVVIPLTATNAGTTYNVTAIVTDAFLDTTGIESITITEITDAFVQDTNSLTIGGNAFRGITTLAAAGTTITIPKQVTVIDIDAFKDTNLTSLVFAPNSNCTTIGTFAFTTTTGVTSTLIGALTIPNTVTSIGIEAFASTKITALTITDIGADVGLSTNTLTIGSGAFSGITTLNSQVTIPKQVTVIDSAAFLNTTLTSLVFTNGSKCTTIGNGAFQTEVAAGTSILAGALTIPSTVTSIGTNAFALTKLISITIEEIAGEFTEAKALTIDSFAFQGISTLTAGGRAIIIPKQVVSIGEGAFQITNLTSLVFNTDSNCTTIGIGAFTGAEDGSISPTLEGALTIPNTVTSIGEIAFASTKITALTITDIAGDVALQGNELTIGPGAFKGITTLTAGGRAITIPKQVVSIGDNAFRSTNLLSLVFTAGSKCTTIGNSAFTNSTDTPTLAGALTIPNTVTSIGTNAFALTKIISLEITDIAGNVDLQGNELAIGDGAFAGITTLTAGGRAITIPKQVVSIGNNAFADTNLLSLVFTNGSKCTTIGDGAFSTTTGGTATLAGALTIPNTVTSIGTGAFFSVKIISLEITDIGATPGLTANELTIGVGAFAGIGTLTAGEITIPKQVVSIGNGAFADTNLLSLVFANGSKCTTIGNGAFTNSTGGASLAGPLTIPNTVTSIGENAFALTAITALTITDIAGNVDLQGNELTIGDGAFAGIQSLTDADGTTITIPTQVVSIGDFAFDETNLLSLVFTNGSKCTTIGAEAFTNTNGANNASLAGALTIPNTVTSIGNAAFAKTQIISLTIEDITTNATLNANELTIGQSAFRSIETLTAGGTTITIPTQVVSIGASAFKSTALTSLAFTNGSKCATIGEEAFRMVNPPATLVGTLVIPPSLTSIGQKAFVGTGLVTLTLPTLTQALLIGQEAFLDVATLRLPNPFILPALLTVGTDAFKGTKLVFGPPTPPTPGQTFTSDNNLYLVTSTAPPTCTLQGFSGAPTATLTVPATVTSGGQAYTVTAIAANAYKDNAVITTLLISAQSKLTTIGPNTFQNTLNLTLPNPLTFPATIQVIGANAFAGTGLTIIYPADMQQLANGARSRASVAGRLGST